MKEETSKYYSIIPCDCSLYYVGQNWRLLDVPNNEHQNHIKRKQFKRSNICEHDCAMGHEIQLLKRTIIKKPRRIIKP